MIYCHHNMQRHTCWITADKQAGKRQVFRIFSYDFAVSECCLDIFPADFSLKHALNGMSAENYFLTIQHAVILPDPMGKNKKSKILAEKENRFIFFTMPLTKTCPLFIFQRIFPC